MYIKRSKLSNLGLQRKKQEKALIPPHHLAEILLSISVLQKHLILVPMSTPDSIITVISMGVSLRTQHPFRVGESFQFTVSNNHCSTYLRAKTHSYSCNRWVNDDKSEIISFLHSLSIWIHAFFEELFEELQKKLNIVYLASPTMTCTYMKRSSKCT